MLGGENWILTQEMVLKPGNWGSESLKQSQVHPETGRKKGDPNFQFTDVSTYFCL